MHGESDHLFTLFCAVENCRELFVDNALQKIKNNK